MDFTNTQTYINLARSFAGESQAGMRYQLIAKAALAQGYKLLSDEVRSIAKNETYHAKIFFEKLIEKAGQQPNIDISAGYPFTGGDILQGLRAAADDEEQESLIVYPAFRDIAEKEGFKDIAAAFDMVSKIEARHKIVFEYLANGFESGVLYKSDTPIDWICDNCGFKTVAKEAYHICPFCQSSQGFVRIHLPKETY